jgi:glycerol-3-phosphate dehydrogenase
VGVTREDGLSALDDANSPWDVCVIGGGSTGLGTALDAASRGYRTVLVERDDFAKATSSRSTKLIHGGVRYLRQGRVTLVLEALKERGLLAHNAPHLVKPLEFVVPAGGIFEAAFYGIGLKMYDLLAGRLGMGPARMLSRREVMKRLPGLNGKGLRAGIAYWDAQFDDARLAITLALSIADRGGVALNYTPVVGLLKKAGRVSGVRIRDEETGSEREIRARVVINATGVFTDEVRRLDDRVAAPVIAASQGAHVVAPLEWLGGRSALMIPRTSDGRILFAIPWHGRLILGTTDNAVQEISAEPRPMEEEIEFILSTAGRFLARKPDRSQLLSAYAGLRPLIRSGGARRSASISREHAIFVSDSGLVSIAGGKWTTYRRMAEDVVNLAARVGSLPQRPCVTATLGLHGKGDAQGVHGADGAKIAALGETELIHPSLPYTRREIIWGVRNEMARGVEDVLARRTRALLLDARASIEAALRVAQLMADELGRDEKWIVSQVDSYTQLAQRYLVRA